MKELAKIGDWFINNVLEPMFGTWWAEITFIIVAVMALALIIFTIILLVKYLKMKPMYKDMESKYLDAMERNNDLSIKLRYSRQDEEALKENIKVLEKEKSELEIKCGKMNNGMADLEATAIELENKNKQLEDKVKELVVYKERSDRAKKAAETKKKNKQQ